jgi:hypothetical protein
MKLNMATSAREISGSPALSAASNTTASSPAIRRTTRLVASAGLSFSCVYLGAHAGQGVQRVQYPGNAAEQPRAVAALARRGVQLVKALAHRLFDLQAFGQLQAPGIGQPGTARGQVDVGQAALALQRMDQPRNHAHQLAGERKLLQLADFALARGDKKIESGFHRVAWSMAATTVPPANPPKLGHACAWN